jgi:hypothetical protein
LGTGCRRLSFLSLGAAVALAAVSGALVAHAQSTKADELDRNLDR